MQVRTFQQYVNLEASQVPTYKKLSYRTQIARKLRAQYADIVCIFTPAVKLDDFWQLLT